MEQTKRKTVIKVVTKPEDIKLDFSRIPDFRAKRIGRAFYRSFMNFVSVPENAAFIEKRAAEIREQREKEERERAERGESAEACQPESEKPNPDEHVIYVVNLPLNPDNKGKRIGD